jgi:T5SS/PEP-CTERM-associated repeat protein
MAMRRRIQLSRSLLTIWIGFSNGAILLVAANIANAACNATGVNFPGSPGAVCVSGTTQQYIIGNVGTGTLTIDNGPPSPLFTAGGLSAGNGGTGNGTITIDGSGTTVTLNPVGQINVLEAGEWGIGTVMISGVAVVDGTNTAGCAVGWCNSFVAKGAGSTGTLTITGGSTLSLPNTLLVGTDNVLQTSPTSVFGTPGGASSGTLNVTSGGTLNTQDATIGLQSTNSIPPATGMETASGTAVVDGAGSTWNIKSPDNFGIGIGGGSNSTGSLSITNGAAVNISATSASLLAGIEIGGEGSRPGG